MKLAQGVPVPIGLPMREKSSRSADHHLPKPGEIIEYDYREDRFDKEPRSPLLTPSRMPMLKCIQWNIERGYELDDIITILQRHQADIICLQELDIACERSGNLNVPFLIAKALKMKCVFVCEFVELKSKLRTPRTQGGGVHGNAILSLYDLEPFTVVHSHHPVDWKKSGDRMREPRRGQRIILGANVKIPSMTTPIRCYSLHFEVFCGIFGRLKQFADVMEDSIKHLEDFPYQLIFGDLNTMAHGIARFSPMYCSDKLRLLSMGYSEAQWWQRYIFDRCQESGINQNLAHHFPHNLSMRDLKALINPYFYDPFCQSKDTTLHNIYGIFRGKLDWTLIRGFHTLAKGMDNHDFKASDHKLLFVIVRPVKPNPDASAFKREIIQAHNEGRVLINHHRIFYRSILGTFASILLLFAWIYFVKISIDGIS